MVGKVVSYFKHAFVEGRQILNAIFIANEDIESRLKSNSGGVSWKAPSGLDGLSDASLQCNSPF